MGNKPGRESGMPSSDETAAEPGPSERLTLRAERRAAWDICAALAVVVAAAAAAATRSEAGERADAALDSEPEA